MMMSNTVSYVRYELRRSYLAQIRDGIGERLINVDTSILGSPAFRAAGWDQNPPEIKRTYSPPIPTAGTAEYFRPPAANLANAEASADEEEEGGMITGRGSTETVAPSYANRRRRRREERREDDESSDLSDESNDEPEPPTRPGQSVRFGGVSDKKQAPERMRSGSSPLRGVDDREGPSVMITSPSKPPSNRLRNGSFGQVDAVKARARRDTTTSSELSSENDLDPSVFKRQQIRSRTPANPPISEDDEESDAKAQTVSDVETDDDVESMASDFSENIESGSLLGQVVGAGSSPLAVREPQAAQAPSPKKAKAVPALQELPPPRPISQLAPVSALSAAIKAREKKSSSPFERFATLSGSGIPNPLYIKIYPPSGSGQTKPLEIMLRKQLDDGTPVTVADAIGFSLWRYTEEKLQVPKALMNLNKWTLRIVEDGEVDFDFPALGRTRPINDFANNNSRPARGRARDKPWDEFGLVEANATQAAENEKLTPQFTDDIIEEPDEESGTEAFPPLPEQLVKPPSAPARGAARPAARRNPITDHRSALAAFRKDSTTAMDVPEAQESHAARRTGAPRTLKIHFTDNSLQPHILPIEVTTDTYISEVFDQVCQKLAVDKGLYVLKVTGTSTIAPSDRTVEALGPTRDALDLVRRRFVGEASFALSNSPGSSSPNAPLLLTASGTPTKKMKRATPAIHPLAQQTDLLALVGSAGSNYKRYNVIRKQPMSFTPSNPRTIVIDGEFLHVMPSDATRGKGYEAGQGKTASFHFSHVVGCKVNRKHPKTMRVLVFRERETKRYDFEARSTDEAAEIVHELKKGMEPFRDMAPQY